jgi:hypothetical protein
LAEKINHIIGLANQNNERPPLGAMHQIGMIHAFYQPDMQGILLGVSNVGQLRESIHFHNLLNHNDFRDVFEKISSIN